MNEAGPGLRRVKSAIFPAARLLGLVFYFTALLTYHSNKNRPVFGMWSYPFLIVVVVSGGLVLAALVAVWHAIRRGSSPARSSKLVDFSILLWGIAYFLAGRAEPTEAGRVIILNFFGSCSTVPALLEWLALVLLFFAPFPLISGNINKKWAKVGLTVGSILFIFVGLEGFLRVKAAVAPVDEGYPTCSSLQWKQRYEKINREGWRDVEHSSSARPGTRRLLVVGDSLALGWGIPNIQNRLGEQVADRLREETGEQWEPINASLGGANTLDEIEYLKKTISYRPNIVLLIYSFNDIDYLAPQIAPTTVPSRARYYPQWVLYSNSYLVQEIMLRVRLIYYRFFANDAPSPEADPYMDQGLLSRHFQDIVRFVRVASERGPPCAWCRLRWTPDRSFEHGTSTLFRWQRQREYQSVPWSIPLMVTRYRS